MDGAVEADCSLVILRYPDWTRKSQTRLSLLTSILTKSRASRRRSLPPLRAYSRTRVSLTTRYGLGKSRNDEHNVFSPSVRRCKDGLLARFSGAAEKYKVRNNDYLNIVVLTTAAYRRAGTWPWGRAKSWC